MLDIKFIRQNIDLVRKSIRAKGEKADVDHLFEVDEKRKEILYEFEQKRAFQNKISKEIAKLKREKKNVETKIKDMKQLAQEIKKIEHRVSQIEAEFKTLLLTIPNVLDQSVPIGNTDADNKFIREFGDRNDLPFVPLTHIELADALDLIDFQRAAKITGSGFISFRGLGASLERALINFMIDYHIQHHNYIEIFPPFIVNRNTMTGTGQLPKLENDMYKIEQDDYFLIPTAEVPLTNLHQNEILYEDDLPIKYVAYTPCFRREAGSYGKETKGLQRIHQFNKVELVQFVHPDKSAQVLENLLNEAEEILQALKLPYRIIELCSVNLSFASAKTYDLEVWTKGMQKYLEVSSCSNFQDFQARRANIRFRSNDDNKVHYLHTLNASGVATPRTMIAILENYQTKDGNIIIPEVLRPYMNGRKML